MWYPPTVISPAASEPLTVLAVKLHCRIDDDDDDDVVTGLIEAARAHVEGYTGLRLVTQTVTAKCGGVFDLARLPFGPLASIASVAYVDVDGADQTLATSVYEARIDGLDAGLVLKYGQTWPSIRPGSRLTVTAVLGYTTIPAAILQAMRLLIATWYENRESVVVGATVQQLPPDSAVDGLLANYRLGA